MSDEFPSNHSVLPEVRRGKRFTTLFLLPWLGHGGADQVALDTIGHRRATGDRIVVVCTDDAPNERLADATGIADEVWTLQTIAPEGHRPAVLDSIIERTNPRIVHVINSRAGFDFLTRLRGRRRRPAVIAHLMGEEGPGGGYPAYAASLRSLIDLFICVSDDLGRMLRRCGIRGDRIAVVRPAIDLDRFHPEAERAPGTAVRLLMPVRLSPEKDPLLAIAAIADANRRGVMATLTITGDGPLRGEVERVARRSAAGAVQVRGVVADMPEEYRRHDAVLLTSMFEAMPLALCEALASGLPVVAPRVGGIPELINADCGILVDERSAEAFGSAIEALADPRVRNAMGAVARRRATEIVSAETSNRGIDSAYEIAMALAT